MGLDLVLGAFVLLTAIRGWLKGFLLQAIRLSGLVACVYLADPVRDLARPYVLPHLPSIRPELVDRLLWWSSALVSYIVVVGFATLVYNLSRRQAFGIAEPNRNDQFAGLMLGAMKGLVAVLFLVDGLQRYALDRVQGIRWAEEQARASKAVTWNRQADPVSKIWASPPVQHFVGQIQRQGLTSPGPTDARSKPEPRPKPLTAASGGPPRLQLTSRTAPEFDTTGLDPEMARAVDGIVKTLGERGAGPAN